MLYCGEFMQMNMSLDRAGYALWSSLNKKQNENRHRDHQTTLRRFSNKKKELHFLPDIDLEPVGHQELYSVHVPTQVQRRVSLIICRQQICPELVQEATYVHVPPGGG